MKKIVILYILHQDLEFDRLATRPGGFVVLINPRPIYKAVISNGDQV